MGCVGSRFDELPVTGFQTRMGIIPVDGTHSVRAEPGRIAYCLRPETTVLKLREKLFSFSGDDCSIEVKIYECNKTCLILKCILPNK